MKTIKLSLIMIFAFAFCNAQRGVSSGSVAMMRNNGMDSRNENGFLNERMVIVEDFMNFHKHKITIPTSSNVALSIDYNNEILKNQNEFILQIGVATKTMNRNEKENGTVNVTLVIDRSGSMSGGKIENVKLAMKKYIAGLGENDYLSIVSFDSESRVDLAATTIGRRKEEFYRLIDNIYPGGSTNINAGMVSGYNEAMKFAGEKINSRVVLLTDGMTNCGETNLENIINNSKQFNDKGIDISTIGVGQQLDFSLLRSLSEAGHGSNHFIGENEEDIQKVFVDELESLLYQIGKNPKMTIELPKNFKIKEFYGYQPQIIGENKITIDFENLNANATQIFIMKVEKINSNSDEISVNLKYSKNNKSIILDKKIDYNSTTFSTNSEIKKNYQIAFMANNLKNAASEYTKKNIGNCSDIISKTINYADLNSDLNDIDIKRLYLILKKYNPNL